MEELTKSQLVLLALFVSFVTSIATGIVTVTLMDQAPPSVTQTINRVVEKTVQTVTPAETQKTTVIKEQVVVKEEDLVVSAIEQNKKSIVAIKGILDGKEVPLGLGTVLSKDGLVVTDHAYTAYAVLRAQYNGVDYVATPIPLDEDHDFAFLKLSPIPTEKDTKTTSDSEQASTEDTSPVFTPVILADSDAIKLGQTAIILGNSNGTSADIGFISNLSYTDPVPATDDADAIPAHLESIEPSIKLTSSSSGGPLILLHGEVAGVNIVAGQNRYTVPANMIKSVAIAYGELSTEDTAKEKTSGFGKITEALSAFAAELKGDSKKQADAPVATTTAQ